MKSEELLNRLKLGSNKRTQSSLDAIYKVCLNHQNDGETDFSYSTIARIGEFDGVPKAQSLRNKSGEKYRSLIQFFKEESAKKNPKRLSPKEDDWIDKIQDPSAKILAKQLIHENKKLKSELNEIIPPQTIIEVRDHKDNFNNIERLSSLERRSIEYLLSDSFKRKLSLSEDKFGAYIDCNGNRLLPVGTVAALKKCLDNL